MVAPSPVPASSVIPHAVVAVVATKHIDYGTIISFMDLPRALSLSQLCQKENSRNTVVEDGGNGTALTNGNGRRKMDQHIFWLLRSQMLSSI